MRKLIATSVLALSAVVLSASSAWADLIPVGELTWTQQVCDTDEECVFSGYFSVVNQTGLNEQDGVFPVLDQIDFSSATLTVDSGAVLLTDLFGDGYNFDSGPMGPWLEAVIGGAAPSGPFQVQGVGSYTFSGNFFTLVSPVLYADIDGFDDAGAPDTESAIIYVEGQRVVPEPVTMSLLGLGLAGTLVRRRRAARN